ncbi:MAG: hypothetical protein A2V90_05580 [Gammaproteobacteria bacterium RBG_16_57_12]|nr:MAG: hypothetical protein A2V90_05580 [Gammaproteobacteria bacterium RBG_16_57_12]
MKRFEKIFETLLWDSRLIVLVAVIISLLSSFAMFYIASVDAFYMISHLAEYMSPALDIDARAELRSATVTHVVEIVDGYLLATFLLIFGLGLYELFISKIDPAEQSADGQGVLVIHSLDDLKARLAKVVLMILIVKFFEFAIRIHYQTPLDILLLGGGIALIGLSLYLAHGSEKH